MQGGNAMKKLIMSISILMFSTALFVASAGNNYYVMNSGEITNCKKIYFRVSDIKVVYENGTSVIIPKAEIKAINVNTEYYEKLPVYENNQKTNKEEFMKFVTTRAGLKLFKYTVSVNKGTGEKGFNVKGYTMEKYVVYKGDQFYVEVTDRNYNTLLGFFGIKVKES